MEYQSVNIYCPRCKRKVFKHDGRGRISVEIKCSKCEKLVIYEPITGKTTLKPIPPRATSSGIRFY